MKPATKPLCCSKIIFLNLDLAQESRAVVSQQEYPIDGKAPDHAEEGHPGAGALMEE